MKNNIRLLAFALSLLCCVVACRKEINFTTNQADKLTYETDTLAFDTVFTQVGSATRSFKVYNPNSQPIKISRISLTNKTNSRFRLNIDGEAAAEFRDIEIGAKDSLYVFAEVTINPDQPLSASPFVIDENLLFEYNSNTDTVVLEAFGQNANYLPFRGAGGTQTVLSNRGGFIFWNDPKPYVIYGILVVDSATLRISAGTKVYIHGAFAKTANGQFYNDGLIYFTRNARLIVQGTPQKPVVFQNDRLETEFKDTSGAWVGIFFEKGSQGNRIANTTIKGSIVGIQADSAAVIDMKNVKIHNTTSSGLIGVGARIKADNCLFYNNGGNAIQVEYGGDYQFRYCTMASSFRSSFEALSLSNSLCVEVNSAGQCIKTIKFPLNATIENSIISGKPDEIKLSDIDPNDPNDFNYSFAHTLLRVEKLVQPLNQEKGGGFTDFFKNHTLNCDSLTTNAKIYRNINENNYRLDSASVALKKAKPLTEVPDDIDGNNRDTEKPNAGAYEKL